MKTWKRNAIVATVLVLICAGVYLNWNATQNQPVNLLDTLDAQQVMNSADIPMEEETAGLTEGDEDYFAQIRLTRQESRDNAVELLQETIAYEESNDAASAAVTSLDAIVGDALAESQVESLVIAKGYEDCVVYMNEDNINVAVSAPAEGLAEADVALISDLVTTQTDYSLEEIRIIEVK